MRFMPKYWWDIYLLNPAKKIGNSGSGSKASNLIKEGGAFEGLVFIILIITLVSLSGCVFKSDPAGFVEIAGLH